MECKAKKEIDQDVYTKLDSLSNRFGINEEKILITDTWDEKHEHWGSAKVNNLQRERGSMLDMVTVWKKEEIENIDGILMQILAGSYESK